MRRGSRNFSCLPNPVPIWGWFSTANVMSSASKNWICRQKAACSSVQVENNSPAAKAGLVPGDIILEVDQTAVIDLAEFNRVVKEFNDGDTVLFLVDRGGQRFISRFRIW